MRKQLLHLAGIIILLILPLSLMAQNRSQGDRAERAKKQQEELKKTLDLKKDQEKKFDKINADFTKKMTEMRNGMDQNSDRSVMREKMTKMNTEREAAIKKILDKKQVKAYDSYLKKQQEARRNRGGRGGGR